MHVAAGVPSVYPTLLCGMPRLMRCPAFETSESSGGLVKIFAQAITSGVMSCVQLAQDKPLWICDNLQMFTDVAEVTRSFAEDFCDTWQADLGTALIPPLLDFITLFSQGLNQDGSAVTLLRVTGIISYCSGLLCNLVTRCRANQILVWENKRFGLVFQDVLPKVSTLDIQLELFEVVLRVYRSAKDTQMSMHPGLACVQSQLDQLTSAKLRKTTFTEKLVDLVVAFNASAHAHSLCSGQPQTGQMDPIAILPLINLCLRNSCTKTCVSKAFGGIAVCQSNLAMLISSQLPDGLQDDWLVIPLQALQTARIQEVVGSGKKIKLISLTAKLPAAFNRNIVAQELLGEMAQRQFDVVVDVQMIGASASKLMAIIDTFKPQVQKDAAQGSVALKRSGQAQTGMLRRRLSIASVPVYQPLPLQAMVKHSQTCDHKLHTTMLKADFETTVSPKHVIKTDYEVGRCKALKLQPQTAAVPLEETKNRKRSQNQCSFAPLQEDQYDPEMLGHPISHTNDAGISKINESTQPRSATGHCVLQHCKAQSDSQRNLVNNTTGDRAKHTNAQGSSLGHARESVLKRRIRHKPAAQGTLDQALHPHDPTCSVANIGAAARAPPAGQSLHTTSYKSAKEVKIGLHSRSTALKRQHEQISEPKVHACHTQAKSDSRLLMPEGQPSGTRSGRPRRQVTQRPVDYRDRSVHESDDEASDPISNPSPAIPHAQSTRELHKNSPLHSFAPQTCSPQSKAGSHHKRQQNAKQHVPALLMGKGTGQGRKSRSEINGHQIVTDTQSDLADIHQTGQLDGHSTLASGHVKGEAPETQAQHVMHLGKAGTDVNRECSVRPRKQQLPTPEDRTIVTGTAGTKSTPQHLIRHETFPPVLETSVVPSPLTSLKRMMPSKVTTSDTDALPTGDPFQFAQHQQLLITGQIQEPFKRFAGPVRTCDPFCPSIMKPAATLCDSLPAFVPATLQEKKAITSDDLASHCQAHAYSQLLSASHHRNLNHDMEPTSTPVVSDAGKKVAASKRRHNAIERCQAEDDASQQTRDQEVMLMRMMNAMMQNEDDDDQDMIQLHAAMSKLIKTKEQRKAQQNDRAIKHSRQKLEDMLHTAARQYAHEEAQLEQAIATTLAVSAKKMADLWQGMSDMHSKHLEVLADKWQQYQELGKNVNDEHHQSLEKMAELKNRWSSTLVSLTQKAEAEMSQVESALSKPKKRNRRQVSASMQQMLSALMH
eukprot:jgi/Ulvmu1/12224/UM086_0014.1